MNKYDEIKNLEIYEVEDAIQEVCDTILKKLEILEKPQRGSCNYYTILLIGGDLERMDILLDKYIYLTPATDDNLEYVKKIMDFKNEVCMRVMKVW